MKSKSLVGAPMSRLVIRHRIILKSTDHRATCVIASERVSPRLICLTFATDLLNRNPQSCQRLMNFARVLIYADLARARPSKQLERSARSAFLGRHNLEPFHKPPGMLLSQAVDHFLYLVITNIAFNPVPTSVNLPDKPAERLRIVVACSICLQAHQQ